MIYLDNAATSFPKPPEVIRAMAGVEEKMGANPGRGGHRLALRAGRVVEHCREEAARLQQADYQKTLAAVIAAGYLRWMAGEDRK